MKYQISIVHRYGDIMTVHLGSRETIYLNSYDVIKEAFVKNGNSFAGRPSDYFYMTELGQSRGDSILPLFSKIDKEK